MGTSQQYTAPQRTTTKAGDLGLSAILQAVGTRRVRRSQNVLLRCGGNPLPLPVEERCFSTEMATIGVYPPFSDTLLMM